MTSSPAYASIPLLPDNKQVTTANTNRDGTGTPVQISVGPTGGSPVGHVIEQIIIQAVGNCTAGMIRFFLSIDGGTTIRLIDEVPVLAVTPSGIVQAFRTSAPDLIGLVLANNSAILYATTNNTETFNIIVQKSGISS